jgi:O-antigen ligase
VHVARLGPALGAAESHAATVGGSLTWLAAAAVATVSLSAAVLEGDGRLFWAAAACTLFATVFALHAEAGVILVILARPSLDLWANEAVATSGWLRINIASLMAITLIVVGAAFVAERWKTIRQAPALLPFILFAFVAAIGVATAPQDGQPVYEWLRLLSLLVLYAMAYGVVRLVGDPRRLAVAILASAALPVAVGAYQTGEGGTRFVAEFGRATGTFLHPVPFGIFLGLIVAFSTPLLLSRALRWPWAFRLALPVALVALIGSYTRTAWIGAIVGLLLVALRRHRVLLLLAPVLVLAVALAVPSTVTRSTDLSDDPTSLGGAGSSVDARFEQWQLNFPKIQQNPVVGHGLGSIAGDEGALVHSDFLRAAVETGLFGLALYVWLLGAVVAGSWRSMTNAARREDRATFAIALGSLAAGVAFIVMSATSNLMTQVVVASAFWCMVAVGHATAPKEAREGR